MENRLNAFLLNASRRVGCLINFQTIFVRELFRFRSMSLRRLEWHNLWQSKLFAYAFLLLFAVASWDSRAYASLILSRLSPIKSSFPWTRVREREEVDRTEKWKPIKPARLYSHPCTKATLYNSLARDCQLFAFSYPIDHFSILDRGYELYRVFQKSYVATEYRMVLKNSSCNMKFLLSDSSATNP